MKLNIIIPTYNRPESLRLLLESLKDQTDLDFSVWVVDDGLECPSTPILAEFKNKFKPRFEIHHLTKKRGGPGTARNHGATAALQGKDDQTLIFIDSDCLLPPHYIQLTRKILVGESTQILGGPDRLYPGSSSLQQAIDFCMTSFFTTGGVRGSRYRISTFYPRGGNLIVRADLFKKIGGFAPLRFGEDIEFGIRARKNGFSAAYRDELFVYHLRRENWMIFFKQVFQAGRSKAAIEKLQPRSLSWVTFLPLIFVLGIFSLGFFPEILFPIYSAYLIFVAIQASLRARSLLVGLLTVFIAIIQNLAFAIGLVVGFASNGLSRPG